MSPLTGVRAGGRHITDFRCSAAVWRERGTYGGRHGRHTRIPTNALSHSGFSARPSPLLSATVRAPSPDSVEAPSGLAPSHGARAGRTGRAYPRGRLKSWVVRCTGVPGAHIPDPRSGAARARTFTSCRNTPAKTPL